jgi:hypothetical protein
MIFSVLIIILSGILHPSGLPLLPGTMGSLPFSCFPYSSIPSRISGKQVFLS